MIINHLIIIEYSENSMSITIYIFHEKDIILHRMGYFENRIFTLEEIGTYYGVSRERIRQIENRAISKLKKLCRNNNITTNLKNYI